MLRLRHLLVTTCMTDAHIYRLAFGLYVKLIQKENNKHSTCVVPAPAGDAVGYEQNS